MDNIITPELMNFMNQKVKELVLITFKGLQKLNVDFQQVPDAYFIDSILKNFVGNMLLKGAKDSKHFEHMGNRFLEEFKDFVEIAKEQLMKENKLEEVH